MKLIENIQFNGAEFVEENGNRLVRNVVMLGPVSSHGYEYTQEAMGAAVRQGLYEGVRIFIGHERGDRNLMQLAGVFRESRHEDGKIKGTAHLLEDDYGRKFWDIAQNMPEAAACSQVADGKLVQHDGKKYVQQITRVHSVDLVVQGATTKQVFESDMPDPGMVAVPRPGPKEKQFEFVPRCIREVQANNPTLSDDQVGAICFMAWQARYEAEGAGGECYLPIAQAENREGSEAHEHKLTTDHNHTAERGSTMKIEAELAQLDTQRQQADGLLTLNPATENVIRREEQANQHEEYLTRERNKPTEQQIEEANAALSTDDRETDADFWLRIREDDKRRRPLQQMTEGELAEINACLHVD